MNGSTHLHCPVTGQALRSMDLSDAERLTGPLQARPDTPYGRTERVLLRADNRAAYPIAATVPILLEPEALTVQKPTYDLRDRRWSEAYEEMEFYNAEAAEAAGAIPRTLVDRLLSHAHARPFPSREWLDAPFDAAAQLDAYNHLGPVTGQRIAQLGGKGLHAVKSLIGGAKEACLVTPMLNEALFAYELARLTGVDDRFYAVVAIAEQLPFADGEFDGIYSGGCLHHMVTEFAGPEIKRVLATGGRFAAVEPWQTTVHRIGTRLVGKREKNSYCRPLTEERLTPLKDTFGDLVTSHHGPVLRYLALGLQKFTKWELSPQAGIRMTRIDDALPLPRRMGGSLAVLAVRR